MGGVADGWAGRDEQPTCLLPQPSLHYETIGVEKVNIVSEVFFRRCKINRF
jgi:hypothetical protein